MLVTLAPLQPQDEVLHLPPDGGPLGGQERQPPAHHLVDQKEIEILSQLAVVALGGLLQHLQVIVELRLGGKGGAVDAGQLLVLLAALPVGAGDREQPEGAQLPRIRHVGTEAEVDELAGSIESGGWVGYLVADQLDLQRLVQPLEEGHRLRLGELFLDERWRRLDDLAHAGLDLRQLLGQESVFEGEVVVKALVGSRPDADDRAGKEIQHSRRHHMGRRMAEGFQVFAHG